MRLTPLEWRTAQKVCTDKQLAALDLWRRGAGKRRIGLLLNIDPSTADYRIRAGVRRIAQHLEATAA